MEPSAPFDIPRNWTFEDSGVARAFDHHVREQLPWYDLVTGALAHFTRHYVPEDGVVYDLGASTGNVGRALAPLLSDRRAHLVPVEPSAEMADLYHGPGKEALVRSRMETLDPFPTADVFILFLSLMFVPVAARRDLLCRLWAGTRPGGAVLIVDKEEPPAGYPGTILRRLTLAGKRAAGVPAEEIVSKELSLSGVQRPLDPKLIPGLFPAAVEWFRFGEFRGWSIER